jgi:hypothetical protein
VHTCVLCHATLQVCDLFTDINRAEPVRLVDMPGKQHYYYMIARQRTLLDTKALLCELQPTTATAATTDALHSTRASYVL